MGDELLLNFGAKFQRSFIILHVKLQNSTDINIIKEIKGDIKNQEHGGLWVRIPSGAQIFSVSSYG